MTDILIPSRRRGYVAAPVAVGVAGAWILAAFAVWLIGTALGGDTSADAGTDSGGLAVEGGPAELAVTAPGNSIANVIIPLEVPPEVVSFAMEASAPVHLAIPSIGVTTPLMDLGLMPDGTLEVPPDGTLAGWYTGASTPGERGPAIIAGHVDWYGPAIFQDLSLMVPGDTVEVTRADGTVAVFEVTEVAQYPKAAFPTEAVYGAVDDAVLRLITCGGVFNRATGHYDDNIVVYASLVPPTAGGSS